jgi:hypothetical protein
VITSLPASTTFTPEQALLSALDLAQNDNLQDVLIVGYDQDGELLIRSSRMSRQGALWISEMLKQWALDGDNA